ncbi:PREDICTED: estrogen sulfotransferase, testis isoform-like [Dufourea novaeangliae]|uniref:Sulfotransferase 1 family member D1 n=1 Tax=Dufourea novaeangliae TaxID=178035 RepID=A0A154P9S9_DUFNO|nr:PREDICTED: estrogen sulfotransferase, testis isoform-like [Dufourea novaeangliae]KZC08591.1 Sulfotransferase 1 family member D1 [Dufourea novaeangliae]
MALQVEEDCELDRILREKFTTEFRKGYVTVNGVCLPQRYEEFARAIEEFEVRDDDIWVCSFPKTGTTWTQEMIWCIANDLDLDGAKTLLPERFPFLEHSILFDYTTIIPRHPEVKLHELVSDSVNYARTRRSPRFIKTHLPFRLLPRQLRTGERKPRIVYVARNPKDTCISYYHHCRLMEGYRDDFNSFCRLFLGAKVCFAPFWDHILEFWDRRTDPNVLFLKYEDMKADLSAVIVKSAGFLKKTMSDDRVTALLKHLSFASMKSNPSVNYEEAVEMNKRLKLIDGNGDFIRSGRVNQWQSEMAKSIIERFDEQTREKLTTRNLLL